MRPALREQKRYSSADLFAVAVKEFKEQEFAGMHPKFLLELFCRVRFALRSPFFFSFHGRSMFALDSRDQDPVRFNAEWQCESGGPMPVP
jgi:hypothetical protein